MPNRETKNTTSVNLPVWLLEWARDKASRDETTLSNVVTIAIKRYKESLEGK